jgi:hypothetical protein
MGKVSWGRLALGGVIASVIAFMTDGFMHGKLVADDWAAVYSALNATAPAEHGASMIYFAIFELGRGMITVFLYVMMRARFGAGPKTAILAGVVSWLAFSIAGPIQYVPLGFYSTGLLIKAGAFQLIATLAAALAGAAVYKDQP